MERNIPKLRFKEFTGEWQEKSFDDIFIHIRNGFVGTIKPYYTKSGGIRYIQGTNIHNGHIADNVKMYVTNEFDKKHPNSRLKTNDILVVQSGHVGECAVVTEKYNGSNCHALIIMTPNKEVKAEFLVELLNSDGQQKQMLNITTGNTIKHILASEMKKYKCLVPDINEQRKTSDFIGVINRRITNQSTKVDSLTELKKGIMQKIFSQETRFKSEDGGEYPEWKSTTIEEISAFIKDGTHGTHKEVKNGIPLLSAKDINNGKIEVPSDCRRISKKDYDAIYRNYTLQEKDIAITVVGTIGRVANVGENTSFAFQRSVAIIRPKNIVNPIFLRYLFETADFNRSLNFRANQSAQAGVYLKELGKIKISVCLEIDEQEKIADFLSTIDSKIDIETQILSTLHTFKKGLLQHMFV